MPKPLLKWVGGKTKLLKELYLYVPNKYTTYIEPFVGGGTLLFSLCPDNGIITDANRELINFYKQVRDNPLEVLSLTKLYELSEKAYYEVRQDDRDINWRVEKSCLQRAARFLYLNKTSFNGMWRVNSSGKMNVPYGKYSKITLPKEEHMIKISRLLRNTLILSVDFYDTLEYVDKNTFVYLDPPYVPYSDTANFTNYASKGFEEYDHVRLVQYCDELTKRGAKFLLSNSDTPLTRSLFRRYSFKSLNVYHSVGATAKSRIDKGEVLVRNYEGNCAGLFL